MDIKTFYEYNHTICAAIYAGGSRVDKVINHPQDYDYISFAPQLQRYSLLRQLHRAKFNTWKSQERLRCRGVKNTQEEESSLDRNEDFSQIRVYPYTQITWFSYLDPLMKLVAGEDVCPKTDVIYEHRQEFITCLQEKANQLISGRIKNQKRWYHLLRGAYILINNSYEVTEEQRREINILHDLEEGWEVVKDKTIQLVQSLK